MARSLWPGRGGPATIDLAPDRTTGPGPRRPGRARRSLLAPGRPAGWPRGGTWGLRHGSVAAPAAWLASVRAASARRGRVPAGPLTGPAPPGLRGSAPGQPARLPARRRVTSSTARNPSSAVPRVARAPVEDHEIGTSDPGRGRLDTTRLQERDHFLHRTGSVRRTLGHHLPVDHLQRRGDFRPQGAERGRRLLQVGHQPLVRRLPHKWRPARQQVVRACSPGCRCRPGCRPRASPRPAPGPCSRPSPCTCRSRSGGRRPTGSRRWPRRGSAPGPSRAPALSPRRPASGCSA